MDDLQGAQDLQTNSNAAVELPVALGQEPGLIWRTWATAHSLKFRPALIATGLSLRGALNLEAIEKTLSEIVRRHGALRANFFPTPGIVDQERYKRHALFMRTGILTPGLYRQSVGACGQIQITRVDISKPSLRTQDERVRQVIEAELDRAFDYAAPPLIRAVLLTLRYGEYLLALIVDHIVSDGWSMRILVKDFVLLYEEYTQGYLTDPNVRMSDYTKLRLWDTRLFSGDYFNQAVAYWRDQWARFGSARLTFSDLYFSLPNATTPTFEFGCEAATICARDAATVRKLARRERITLNMFHLAIYAIAMHGYTRRARVPIWCHFANRSQNESQRVVARLVNTHLVGFDLDSNMTFRMFLRQVRTTVLQAATYQELPIEYLWQTLRCHPRFRDVGILVDVRIAPELYSRPHRALDGVVMTHADIPQSRRYFSNLALHVETHISQMVLRLKYCKDWFAADKMSVVLGDLQRIIVQAAEDPEMTIRRLADVTTRSSSHDVVARPCAEMSEFVVIGSDLMPNGHP